MFTQLLHEDVRFPADGTLVFLAMRFLVALQITSRLECSSARIASVSCFVVRFHVEVELCLDGERFSTRHAPVRGIAVNSQMCEQILFLLVGFATDVTLVRSLCLRCGYATEIKVKRSNVAPSSKMGETSIRVLVVRMIRFLLRCRR